MNQLDKNQLPEQDFTKVYLSELEDIKQRKGLPQSSVQSIQKEIDRIKSKRPEASDENGKDVLKCLQSGSENRSGWYSVLPSSKANLMGLALSGGGIRSATFNLGLLQVLCNNEILAKVDYLSTVSGGGYIGSCMTTLLNSEPQSESIGIKKDVFPLGINMDKENQPTLEKEPVRRLRYFSNYLTAEGGFVNKYLRPAMVFLRGVVLNFSLLIPYLIALSLLLSVAFNVKIVFPMFEKNQWFFDIQEFKSSLTAYEKAQAELKAYILKHTSSLYIGDGDQRFETAEALLASENKYSGLKDAVENSRLSLKQEWRTIWKIPVIVFGLLIVGAIFLRFNYEKSFDQRQNFSRVLAWLLFFSLLTLFIQLYGILIVYWETWQITSWITLTSLLSFIVPKLLQSADAAEAKGKKPWMQLAIAVGLLALVPLFLLFLSGLAISYVSDANYRNDVIPVLIVGFIIFAYINRRFINLNEISLHNFYRDRLSRAYLFKYQPDAHPSTTHWDDIKLSEIKAQNGPYHIFNTVLNLKRKMPDTDTDGTKKPKDEFHVEEIFRSGESFVLTKNWCGSRVTGYCPTDTYEEADPHINVGTAVAISGAAANIGMAHKNIFAVRLLMGLLNVRLGYWALHPIKAMEGRKPWLLRGFPGSVQALQEWFGSYRLDPPRYINLSDGGHFDNIGVYELLRRRCKYIIVGDAEADSDMKFEALSYILRMARIDFGIEIDIDTTDIKPDHASGFSRNHCVVGRINYPEGDFGYLLYCKASLSGDEPEHLYEYKVKHPQFPHQTTADQWFDEQQFEAYRELGYHVGKKAFAPVVETEIRDNEELFNALKEFWHPHSEAIEAQFTRHTVELNKIVSEIKNDEDLKFMDAQMYPEWDHLISPPTGKELPDENKPFSYFWLPSKDKEIRKGFYLCNLMMQLMENVYTDLNLENEHTHPDNRGWMNLFRHWSWSGMFRVSWAISACTFGARFQKFCEKHLELDLGKLSVRKRNDVDVAVKEELNPYEQRVGKYFTRDDNFLFASLFVLELKVKNPLDSDTNKTFHFGFALVNAANELSFFRVQDHLRQMGLGRRALKELKAYRDEDIKIENYSLELLKFLEAEKESKAETEEDADAILIEEQDLVRFDRMCKQAGLSKAP
jgi:hypothetical protein